MLCVLAAGLGASPAAAAGSPRPAALPYLAVDQDMPDPAILQFKGTYYVYSTNAATNAGYFNVPVATSAHLYSGWTQLTQDALPQVGAWANSGLTWAPDVTRLADGQFLMYYTAQDRASGMQCVGAATATNPAGPFTPVGTKPLVCPTSIGGAIDPAAFTDTNGQHYLVYKNNGNAIGQPSWLYVQRVAADGVTLIGQPTATIQSTFEGPFIEAPYLVKHGSTYVMFYSYGQWWNCTYTEGYATAPSLTGPWTKSNTPALSSAQFGNKVCGPGGMSVLQRPNSNLSDNVIVFHGVREQPAFHRAFYVDNLTWNGNTPVAGGTVPTSP